MKSDGPKVYILLNRGERQTKKDENGTLRHELAAGWMGEISSSLKEAGIKVTSIGNPGLHTRGSNEDLKKYSEIQEYIRHALVEGLIDEALIAADGNNNDFIPLPSGENYYIKFYENIANNLFWPFFHSLLGLFQEQFFDKDGKFSLPDSIENDFKIYLEKNEQPGQIFVRETANLIERPIFWVHDYHFLLVPEIIRKLLPNQPIGYFHHIPFPAFEIMKLLPRPILEKIIKGMLGADYIGFHTENYRQNFIECVTSLFPKEVKKKAGYLIYQNRKILVDVNPIGLDYEKHSKFTPDDEMLKTLSGLRNTEDHQLILSMSRLDPPKGILEVLEAIDRLLTNYPEWIGKFTLVLQVIPSRLGVPAYKELDDAIKIKLQTIKEKYKTHNPVHFINRGIKFEKIKTLQAECDILVIATEADGLNLVTLETIASKEQQKKEEEQDQNNVKPLCLVLSKGTGVSQYLPDGPIFVPNILENSTTPPISENRRNLYIEEIKEGIKTALEMPKEERIKRTQTMQASTKKLKLTDWAKRCIDLTVKTASLSQKMKQKSTKLKYSFFIDEPHCNPHQPPAGVVKHNP